MTKSNLFRSVNVDMCADCSMPDPAWASVNRGVLMCNECAGIHRNLGRHVSQVKHLQRSQWYPNQLSMVRHLSTVGANSIWEHSLLDPAQMRSGKRKPSPTDPVHPAKNDFIHAKYEQLAFVHRPSHRDEDDLGRQLHSSVRTANLDTSLRLLSLGAQANFFHTERGNTPLHVAAKAGQSLQVELLVTYGADPGGLDVHRKTPDDLAREEGHVELACRIVDLQYELSDRLSYFVWKIKPDHKTKNHYAIPKIHDNGVGVDGKKRLQALSNQIFEELAMDIYDEVDRRENEQIWQEMKQASGKVAPTADHVAVPFLTVNPDYSTTRNQGRQKLARFTTQEFAILINDILYDIVRRQSLYDGTPLVQQQANNVTIEEPIYDDVPPDLDYESIENSVAAGPSFSEFLLLKQKLTQSEGEVSKLKELNRELSQKVTTLAKQNHELIKRQNSHHYNASAFKPPADGKAPAVSTTTSKPPIASLSPLSPRSAAGNFLRPNSVYNPHDSFGSQTSLTSAEGRERRKTIHETQHPDLPHLIAGQLVNAHGTNKPIKQMRDQSPHNSVGSDYDNNITTGSTVASAAGTRTGDSPNQQKESAAGSENTNDNNNTVVDKSSSASNSPELSLGGGTEQGAASGSGDDIVAEDLEGLPKADIVIRKTETVTKNIQNLLQAAQKKQMDSYLSCSENILIAVREIVSLFPQNPTVPTMKEIIIKLDRSAEKLRDQCRDVTERDLEVHSKQITEDIIKNAYEIAKAEKELVTLTTKLRSSSKVSLSSN